MLTLDEQEVSILIEPVSDRVKIYCSVPGSIRKFDGYCENSPEEWRCVDVSKVNGEIIGKSYECSKKMILLRGKAPGKRQLSEAERAALSERMKEIRRQQLVKINSTL